MSDALIGYTGFIGGTLQRQHVFSHLYNSRNIEQLRGQSFGTIYCAGAPAQKWIANKNPEADHANIMRLCEHLAQCRAQRFVLISTVDVYRDAMGVDEDTPTDIEALAAYGKHRLMLEQFVQRHFDNALVVRLPGLFGEGLKKNFIFDMLGQRCLDLTDARSVFQFYNLARLLPDCRRAMDAALRVVNFAVAPTACHAVAQRCFDTEFNNHSENGPVCYDMHTKHAEVFGRSGPYLMDADEVFHDLRVFVQATRRGRLAS